MVWYSYGTPNQFRFWAINFKNDGEDGGWHVRLGPSPREAYEATGFCNPMFKGGGVLAFIDQLFWLAETTKKATP